MWQTHHLQTSRGSFEVFQAGSGPPLCTTHLYSSFNASGDHFADSFTQVRTVYLVNLRGAGGSDPEEHPEDLSMEAAVADLEAIREALGHDLWDFAGHSTGGMLGLLYAVLRPRSLRTVIAVGAAASNRYADDPGCIYNQRHPRFQEMQDLIEALKADDLAPAERARLAKDRTKLSLHQPERYAEYFPPGVQKRMCGPRLNYFGQVDFPRFDLVRQLEDCQVPALIACGRHDVQCPLPSSEEMARVMPHARLAVFERSNHYPFLEEREAFQDELKVFLDHPR
jgi:proline iminopeptidase